MNKIISEQLQIELLKYLQERPLKEVANLFAALNSLKPEKDQKPEA